MIRPLDRLDACAAKTVGLRLAIRQGLGLSQAPILRFGVDKVFEAAALEIADNRQNERQADHERDRTDIDFKGVKILHPLFIDMTLGSVTLKKETPFGPIVENFCSLLWPKNKERRATLWYFCKVK